MIQQPDNPPPELHEVYQTWQVDRLLADLLHAYDSIRAERQNRINKIKELSPTLRDYLLLLLAGKSPKEIASHFCHHPNQAQADTVRHRLSQELYPVIAKLLQQRSISFKTVQWQIIPDLLEKAGYKILPKSNQSDLFSPDLGLTLQIAEAGLKQYLFISEQYQILDWPNQGTKLAQNWSDLELFIKWCQAPERYQSLKILLQNTQQYSYIYGSYQKRLDQIEGLLQVADLKDTATITEAILEKSWLLTLMNSWKEADKLYQIISSNSDPILQLKLTKNQAVWHLQQQHYSQSLEYLRQARIILKYCHLDPERSQRWQIILDYYEPQIYFHLEQYSLAQSLYQKAWDKAKQFGWQRITFALQNWMARIALVKGDFYQARYRLEHGLQTSLLYDDCQLNACYNLSLARLEKVEGNFSKSRYWGTEALSKFENLGMVDKVIQAQSLLKSLETV
ncbi:MAG TPA: hypothetical protein DCQ51_00665 [Planktothrix sp. UBA8407]|jgi:hypothetical protein|nr:hypothetical protein [Planktothrix sp. UBA8407]HBK21012.1 hypothetical protein [Planktothrix sp. UBA10369]